MTISYSVRDKASDMCLKLHNQGCMKQRATSNLQCNIVEVKNTFVNYTVTCQAWSHLLICR